MAVVAREQKGLTGPAVVHAKSNPAVDEQRDCLLSLEQQDNHLRREEACELISLVGTLFVALSFCACANCEWNGMGACQDQALCAGCADLHWKSACLLHPSSCEMCGTCGFCTAGGLGCRNLSRGLQFVAEALKHHSGFSE